MGTRVKNVNVEIFSAGDGVNYPKKGQTVTLHYSGYLPNGQMFDSVRILYFVCLIFRFVY